MCVSCRRIRGFTLLEVLLVVAILGLIIAVAAGSFANYGRQQAFNEQVDGVALLLLETRQKTLGAQYDQSHGVHVDTSTITAYRGSSYLAAVSSTTYALQSSVSATTSFSDGSDYVTFTRVTGMPSATGTIVFSDVQLGRTATITISASGLIQY